MVLVVFVVFVVLVVEEYRRLFGYRLFNNSCVSSSISFRNGKQFVFKCCVVVILLGDCISIFVRNIWIRIFVCFEKRNVIIVFLVFEKVLMVLVGFEEKSICFFKGGNSQYVYEKILEDFLILEIVGGYEILRIGERGNCQFMVIFMLFGGYIVLYFKVIIVFVKGYIRFFQKDLVFIFLFEQE